MSKSIVMLYSIISYFMGVIGLVCIIAALAGLMPYGFWLERSAMNVNPYLWNLGLVAIWGFIHTAMARPGFKRWLTRMIPAAAERSTYVLVAGITSVLLIALWKNIPGVIWNIGSAPLAFALWGLFIFGWVFLLASTFAINHFDLFGLRQAYLNFKNRPQPPLKFVKRAMYRYIRHPIQTGVLIGVWATPMMSQTQICLSIGFTLYIFIGLWFEERDLIAEHGDEYRAYRRTAGKLLPKIRA